MGENDSSHFTSVGLQYRLHRFDVANISLNEMLGMRLPASKPLEIHRRQNMLGAGDNLAHQRLKAYLRSSAVCLAPPDLPGEACFVFKAWEAVYSDQAAYLM